MPTEMTPRAAHLEPEVSDRGFTALPTLSGTFADKPSGEVTVYESSAATEPRLWLDVNGEKIQLTAENAWRLADQLRTAVRNHYQGNATPEWATD